MSTGTVALTAALAAAILAAGVGSSDRARAADVIVGAGEDSPLHFNVGRALCRAISKSTKAMTCEAERIAGQGRVR